MPVAGAVSAATAGVAGIPAIPKKFSFYPYSVEAGVPGVKQRPVPEIAKIVRDTGFDGIGYLLWLDEREELENLRAVDDCGLKMMMFEPRGINLAPGAAPFDPRLPDAIRRLKGRDVTLAFNFGGRKPVDPEGVGPAIKILRELGDIAAETGVRISVYNHDKSWTESVPFNIEVVKQTNHPRVGFNFNVCHWVKVEGARDYAPLLRDNASKLFCVMICGSEIGAPWSKVNGLIQPLDGGTFDNRALVSLLCQIGYDSPVGLMCHSIPGDPREHLARSMKVWKSWFEVSP